LGYSVPELAGRLREILGLGREWRVFIVGAGKIGAALAQYRGFRQRGFTILAAYDNNPDKVGRQLEGIAVRDIAQLEADIRREKPDIVVLTVPTEEAQEVVDRVVKAGVRAILNFAPTQLQAPPDVTIKTVNMAMELEGLSFALTNRE
jgi:redox-sensing transcriptional repressor